jgi:Uma2 family endonuclease
MPRAACRRAAALHDRAMATAAAAVQITAEDYRQMPLGPPYFQLVEGGLYLSPSPDFFHQGVAFRLARKLAEFVENHGLGTVQIAPSDVELDEVNVVQPDVYFVSRARRRIITRQGVTGAPDLVVEVLSPRTAALDLGAKLKAYARAGVTEAWFVDRTKRRVLVYRFAEDATKPAAELRTKDTLTTPLLPGFALPVKEVFRRQ